MQRLPGRPWLFVLVLCGSVISTGCNGIGQPRRRIGALPFPGIATLYAVADPADLGRHRSRAFPPPPFAPAELERGIVYTTRAGFLDLAHVRDTIDWTRYSAQHVRAALREGKPSLVLAGMDRTTFHLDFAVPDDWTTLPDPERTALLDELSVRIGMRLGYLMMTWHEVQSWYGYRSSGLVSERASAFTYDDILSHVVGAEVAGEAVRVAGPGDGPAFDDAVTVALDAKLKELGAVSAAQTRRAVASVNGTWWDGGRPLKRQTRVGLQSGRVTPWLVPEMRGEGPPPSFAIPVVGTLRGRDGDAMVSIELEPRSWEAAHIRGQLPENPRRLSPRVHLPELLEAIRTEMRQQFGDAVDRT